MIHIYCRVCTGNFNPSIASLRSHTVSDLSRVSNGGLLSLCRYPEALGPFTHGWVWI